MNKSLRTAFFLCSLLFFLLHPVRVFAQAGGGDENTLYIIVIEGTVEVAPAGTQNWAPAKLNQKLQPGDQVRTRALSRATLRSKARGETTMGESDFRVVEDTRPGGGTLLNLVRGTFAFFSSGKPTPITIRNQTASAAGRGTEYVVRVDDNERIEITVFDGLVDFTNALGGVTITNGEQAVAVPGQAPVKSPALNAINLIQWVLYYPGVLNVDELPWTDAAKNELGASLAAYRSGDLVAALNAWPANRAPVSDPEKVYRAALMLVVGEVDQSKSVLDTLAQPSEFGLALRKLTAAVKNEEFTDVAGPKTAAGWVAESYYRQSRLNLDGALAAARAAALAAPDFGFAWARVAELEFSFGRVDESLAALDKALTLSPRHAGALALKGFLFSAQNKIPEAIRQFDAAIAVDGALPDAWLGRGLCRIRSGDARGGREDLRTAAALEPNRAVLRSYLAKAYSDGGDDRHATHEIELARRLDANDPTSWLYSALHNQQQNRINTAVRELEHAQDLNTNRGVYRSALLLDQDRAVRSANLASIYHDVGMTDVSVREAGRAVSDDYANYSAHLFLANSYERLRDPKQINLRYETPTFAEYLIANLLAPVGAGTLSPAVSQQEYSKLFERDHFGVSSRTEYQSGGNWFAEGAQYGTFGNASYSIEGLYRSDHGQRFNNDFELRSFSVQFKQQLTAHDTIYVQASDSRVTGGDVGQNYENQTLNPRLRTRETQQPVVLAGYHHEWGPGSHTLFLAARLDDTYNVRNRSPLYNNLLLVATGENGTPHGVSPTTNDLSYESRLTIYSAELQQIFATPRHTTVLGARVQAGEFETESLQTNYVAVRFFPKTFGPRQDFSTDFQRTTFYGYHSWRIVESFQLIGGLTYDYISFPENYRFSPISDRVEKVSRLSPKAGFIWTPDPDSAVRFAYAQSLGGASIDQSFQIEPSQVAGFNQSFRSLIPESVAAANAGARFETYGLSLEHRFPTETYVGVSGELLNSKVRRSIGTADFDEDTPADAFVVGSHPEHLDFSEKSVTATLNQLVGKEWAFGARYRWSRAELSDDFPGIPRVSAAFEPHRDFASVLQQLTLYAIYNHPSGWFGQVQGVWSRQSNHGSGFGGAEPGDDFWQCNAFVGYCFWQRRAEATVGVLNIGDQNYKLEPLNLYSELPRERTFVARLSFKF